LIEERAVATSGLRWTVLRGSVLAAIALLAGLGSSAAAAADAARPNLVLIMADDFGYELVGADGGTSYRTPQLDKLAASGMRFEHCYVQPLCTPTRVQLMTGLYNVRNYTTFGEMDPQAVTFANVLKQAGYTTCMAGKWQLGRDPEQPKRYGFDEYCLWQHLRRPPRYANPGLEINGVEKDFRGGEYGPDLVNAYALDFLSRHRERPFFLYYPMMLTHAPFLPTPDSADWDPKAQGEPKSRDPRHLADMVAYADKLVGRVVSRLDELGLRERTLVIFLGDNGTTAGVRSKMGERTIVGGKGTTTPAGMRVPLLASWPGTIQPGKVCSDLVDSTDFLPTLCEAAAIAPPAKIDGRSFFAQLRGRPGHPREWSYCWYSPRREVPQEFAFTPRYRLDRDGSFALFERPQPRKATPVPADDPQAAAVRATLQKALDHYRDARPAGLDPGGRRAERRRPRGGNDE
jgi:arylsulfatase A